MPETRGKNRVLRSGDTMTGDLSLDSAVPTLRSGVSKNLVVNGNGGAVFLQSGGTTRLVIGATVSTTRSAVGADGVLFPIQAPTASAPAYVKGGLYFDTTLNKLMVGGAVGWETVTSV